VCASGVILGDVCEVPGERETERASWLALAEGRSDDSNGGAPKQQKGVELKSKPQVVHGTRYLPTLP
jgi:hypothetical protein